MLKTSTGSCLNTVLFYFVQLLLLSSSPFCFVLLLFFFLNQNHLHKSFPNNPLSSISLPSPVIKNTHINKEIVRKTCIFQSIYQTINPITTTKKKNFWGREKKSFKQCCLCRCSSVLCFSSPAPQPPLPKKKKSHKFGVLKALWFSFICNPSFLLLFLVKREKKDENN